MKKIVYSDSLCFMLPDSYHYSFENKGTDHEWFRLMKGGNSEEYDYGFLLSEYTIDKPCDDIKGMQKELLSSISGSFNNANIYTFEGDVRAELACFRTDDCEGAEDYAGMFSCDIVFFISDYAFVNLSISVSYASDAENTELFRTVLEVVKGVRTENGGRIYTGNITAEELKNRIMPERKSFISDFFSDLDDLDDLDEDEEGEDDEEVDDFLYSLFGLSKKFSRGVPDEELYPHYMYCFCSGPPAIPGVKMVVNSDGTEYSFIPVSSDDSGDPVYKKIKEADKGNYVLYKKADEMKRLFHVNPGVFDPSRDRECEIEQMLMEKACMFSALRSFLWTVREYCNDKKCRPEDIEFSELSEMLSFIADSNYLNYKEEKGNRGLCFGSDFNVFFVPDSLKQEYVKKLLPSEEDIKRVKEIKAKYPTYNEIPAEVHSLDDLRKDLEFIYPGVKTLFDELKKNRDYNEALTGDEADIVYAWCILARAAKEPFLSADGPFRCFFTQPEDSYPEEEASPELKKAEEDMNTFIKFREAAEEKKKEEEAEKKRRKDKARASGKSNADDVNMYIILTNEEKLGCLSRDEKEFYEFYEDDFPALSEKETLKLRRSILEKMKNGEDFSAFKEEFLKRSVEERFDVSTKNLKNASEESDMEKLAEWAIKNSKEWYSSSEQKEVSLLMKRELNEFRKSLDDQLISINRQWTVFSGVRDSLEIAVTDPGPDGIEIKPQNRNFQLIADGCLVSVRIAGDGLFKICIPVMNCFSWYWGVTVRDIWEIALKNGVSGNGEEIENAGEIALKAIKSIRKTFPDRKKY